jgi:predicted phosphate transport protein (TIGR00153 family)
MLKAAVALKVGFKDGIISREEQLKIKEIEHEGDHHVHRSLQIIEDAFITPIDQSDLIDILKSIENVTDHIDYVSAHIYMINIKEPDAFYNRFIDIMVNQAEMALDLMKHLRRFKKMNLEEMNRLIKEINTLEEDADRLYIEGMRELFTHENDPKRIIQKKEIYGRLEDTCDRLEDVANAVQRLLVAKI